MIRYLSSLTALVAAASLALPSYALTLSSKDIKPGQMLAKAQEFTGFGCSGKNLSPHLAWRDAPKKTKAFAITVYDPDAPTGSGWWHWQVVNIPAKVKELKTGAGDISGRKLPRGAMQIENDYGEAAFGGACPPVGHGLHRYQFTLHALSEPLKLPKGASGALAGYMINANSLASDTIEAWYVRQ